jgi:quercetin dioxygenase-like cupin family protein
MASETIGIGGLELRFLQTKEETAGSLDAFEMTVQPNARMPVAHYHESWDETIYGLDGASTWRVDGQDIVLNPGQSVFIKRGIVHSFRNDTQEPASCLLHPDAGRTWTWLFPRDCGAARRRRAGPGKNEGGHGALRARARPAMTDLTSPRDVRRRNRCPCRRGRTDSAPSGDPSGAWARAR